MGTINGKTVGVSDFADEVSPAFPVVRDIVKEIGDCYRYRYVCMSYVQNNLRLRYRKSFLGFFWSILTPLISYLILGLVFSFTMKVQVPNFLVYFFSGSVFFNLLNVGITRAPTVMIENETYIKKIYVPKLVFVLNGIMLETTNFLLGLVALIALGLATGRLDLHWSMLFVPIPIFCAMISLIGITCFLSVFAVFFRDLAHMVPIFMQSLLFLTPVFYPIEAVPDAFRWLVNYNPLYYFVETFRTPVVNGTLPHLKFIAIMMCFSFALFAIGLIFLKKYDNKIVFKL